jgi:hypothetical protein
MLDELKNGLLYPASSLLASYHPSLPAPNLPSLKACLLPLDYSDMTLYFCADRRYGAGIDLITNNL